MRILAQIITDFRATVYANPDHEEDLLGKAQEHLTVLAKRAGLDLPEKFLTIEVNPCFERWILTPIEDERILIQIPHPPKPRGLVASFAAGCRSRLADGCPNTTSMPSKKFNIKKGCLPPEEA